MSSQQHILITGASSGIGLALATHYLKAGHKVLALARHTELLDELRAAYPSTCIPVRVDLTNRENCVSVASWIENEIGYLDMAILNAGTCEYVDVQHLSAEPFDKVMAINWQGTINTLVFALPLLRKATAQGKTAHLIGVSSMASLLPMPRSQAYGASKVALEYLFNTLRVDLAKEPITISIVRPGFVKTPLTDRNDFAMPWMLNPEQAVQKIVKGIARRKWIIQFPWPLVCLMRFVACLPLVWQTKLLQQLSRA
jgi:short-subunit dehydrogenase